MTPGLVILTLHQVWCSCWVWDLPCISVIYYQQVKLRRSFLARYPLSALQTCHCISFSCYPFEEYFNKSLPQLNCPRKKKCCVLMPCVLHFASEGYLWWWGKYAWEVFIRYIELFRVRVGEKVMIEVVRIIICCIEVAECPLLLWLL